MAGRHSLRNRLLIVCALILAVAATHSLWLVWMGDLLVHADQPIHADVIVALAGDPYGHRIIKAAELAKSGYAPKVLVSGPPGFYGSHECDLAIPFAVAHGYPAGLFIAVPHDSHSTEEEGRALFPLLTKMHAHNVIVVTSDYHTRRASRILAATWPGIEICMVDAPDEFFSPAGWWHNREGRKIFLLEWTKTVTSMLGM